MNYAVINDWSLKKMKPYIFGSREYCEGACAVLRREHPSSSPKVVEADKVEITLLRMKAGELLDISESG